MIRFLLIAAFSFSFFAGCGPEKSSTELRDETRNEERDLNAKLEKEELQRRADLRWPVVERAEGTFEGSYEADGRRVVKVDLVLEYAEEVIPLKNSNEVFNMPSLIGRFTQQSSSITTTLMTEEFVENTGEVRMISNGRNDGRGPQLRFKVRDDGKLAVRLILPSVNLDKNLVFTRKRN